ncbi:hypothetical protein [Pseudomonas sp. BN414]|uniref:hypothetical protein n=1 Tax=Pseudomonas sp. BN414 TaxID=2567888 RepID=UPI0024580885|nr:hypothetical protein [Pseudomonas sp. BN414]
MLNDTAGDTILLKVPGIPPIERSEEEAAADALAGRQWWNQAILSSTDQKLHGTALDGWVYCDPAGRRWRVSKIVDLSGSYTVELRLFGMFGVAEEVHTYAVSLADLGQSTPAIDDVNAATLSIQLRDVWRDGSRALYAIRTSRLVNGAGDWPAVTQSRWLPAMGWLEMTISGPGEDAAIGLSVLANRAETIGTYSITADPPTPTTQFWLTETVTVVEDAIKRTTTRVPVMNSAVVPAGDAEQFGNAYLDGVSRGHVRPGTVSSTEGRRGIILAMWYASDGSHEQLTMDIEEYNSYSATEVPWSISGEDVTEFIKATGETNVLSRYTESASNSFARSTQFALILRLDGVEVVREEGAVGNSSGTLYYDREDGLSDLPIAFWHSTAVLADETNLDLLFARRFLGLDQIRYGPAGTDVFYAPYQLSNHLWCVLKNTKAGTVYTWRWGPAFGPESVSDGEITTSTHSSGLRLYGSWCPVTGQMARSTSRIVWT